MQKYAFQKFDEKTMARAIGKDLPLSVKHSAMVCNAIRGKDIVKAKQILTNTMNLKTGIKFTRFNTDRAHQKGIGAGRFPVKTCKHILDIIKSAESNAEQKGLQNLKIVHICAHKAATPWHYGRHRRRQMKRAHIEVIIRESTSLTKNDNHNSERSRDAAKEIKEVSKAPKVSESKVESKDIVKNKGNKTTEIKKVESEVVKE